jgi:hypothetical protein
LVQGKEAENFILRAIKISPNNSDTLFTSVLVHEIIGHRDEALQASRPGRYGRLFAGRH